MQSQKVEQVEENKEAYSLGDIKEVLKSCKSVAEIEDSVPEFLYLEDSEKVVCTVCSTLFGYNNEGEGGKKISTQLASLKNYLKIHLDSNYHKAALAKLDEEENMNKKMENRNTVVGMNLARTTFYLLSNGLPSHYPTLLSTPQEWP